MCTVLYGSINRKSPTKSDVHVTRIEVDALAIMAIFGPGE